MILEFDDVCKNYKQGKTNVEVLQNLSFSIKQGEIIAIVGASGSGKSTLLHLAGLLDAPSKGNITILGKNTKELSEKQKDLFRLKNLGFVYQHHHLLADFTTLENVIMPQLILGESPANANKKAYHLLEKLKIADKANSFPGELSGGQQQRVAIARSIINQPKLILADEPTGNLDHNNALEVFSLMQELSSQLNTTIILATHSLELAQKANSIFELYNQKLSKIK